MQDTHAYREGISAGDERQAVKAAICSETVAAATAELAGGLRAVVLTGSVARDEATIVTDGVRERLLGDADFFLVFHDGTPMPPESAIRRAAEKAEAALRERGVEVAVGLAAVYPSYFRALPPHISPYELRSCGCVAWGDPEILSLVPQFSAAQISREDAWRLLANRLVEQLEAIAGSSSSGGAAGPDLRYRLVKLYLDMATSYLVFAGRYRPTYRQREQALRELAAGSPNADAPFPLGPFAARIAACTRFKIDAEPFDTPTPELLDEAVGFARRLWQWELGQLSGASPELPGSDPMSAWTALQPWRARLRGWASVLRRSGWLRSSGEWPRWALLLWRGSPRYLTYSVAAELFFATPELAAAGSAQSAPALDWKALERRLPSRTAGQPGTPEWQRLARAAAHNYHRYLETTTA